MTEASRVNVTGGAPQHREKLTSRRDAYATVATANAYGGKRWIVIDMQRQRARQPVEADVEEDLRHRQAIDAAIMGTRNCRHRFPFSTDTSFCA
jgi:hypothetical protein